jgi:hypothetical protein
MTDDAWHYFAIFSQVAAANKLCLVDMHDRNANPAEGQGDLCPALLSASRASGQRYGALTMATYGRSFVWCWHADSRKLQRWIACVKVHFQDGIPWDPKIGTSGLSRVSITEGNGLRSAQACIPSKIHLSVDRDDDQDVRSTCG